MKKFIDCGNSPQILNEIKKYINKYDCPKINLDLSRMNILDAAKVMMLSSAYHLNKYPEGKIRCQVKSGDIKGLVAAYMTKNIEVVT